MTRRNILDEFIYSYIGTNYGVVDDDFYITKFLTPRYIRLDPRRKLFNCKECKTYSLKNLAREEINLYLPFRFLKRYYVVIEPFGENLCPNRYR